MKEKDNVASPHRTGNGELHEIDHYIKNDESLGAAGGIYSSVHDLSKWMLLHLNGGRYGDSLSSRLITEESYNELWKPHTQISFDVKTKPPHNTHFKAYGLGWVLQDRGGYVTVEHTGGLPGMLSRTVLVPELNVGVVVLTNTSPGGNSYWTLAMHIADGYLGVKRTDWVSWANNRLDKQQTVGDSVTTAVWEKIKNNKSEAPDFSNYVGVYEDRWFGKIRVWQKGGGLWMKSVRSPRLTGQMFFYRANTFAVEWEYEDDPCDAFAMFTLNENGQAVGLKMKGISPNIDFSYDFQDLDLKRVNK